MNAVPADFQPPLCSAEKAPPFKKPHSCGLFRCLRKMFRLPSADFSIVKLIFCISMF
jgi:hypothetical protein